MGNTYQDKITEIQSNNSFLKNKLEGGKKFKLISDFKPAGDQPQAIKQLIKTLMQWVKTPRATIGMD